MGSLALLSEKPHKAWDEVPAKEVRKVVEHEGDFVPLDRTVAELYAEHEVQIWVEFLSRGVVGDREHYLVVFERLTIDVGSPAQRIGGATRQKSGPSKPADRTCRHDELTVFVDVVEFVHPPEKRRFEGSVVRLYRFDCLDDVGTNAGMNVDSDGFACPRTLVPERTRLVERELRPIRGSAITGNNELTSQVVESGTEVVDAVSQDGREIGSQRWRIDGPVDVFRSVAVHLAGESVRAEVIQVPDVLLEGIAVYLRPSQFDRYAFRAGRWGPRHWVSLTDCLPKDQGAYRVGGGE